MSQQSKQVTPEQVYIDLVRFLAHPDTLRIVKRMQAQCTALGVKYSKAVRQAAEVLYRLVAKHDHLVPADAGLEECLERYRAGQPLATWLVTSALRVTFTEIAAVQLKRGEKESASHE